MRLLTVSLAIVAGLAAAACLACQRAPCLSDAPTRSPLPLARSAGGPVPA